MFWAKEVAKRSQGDRKEVARRSQGGRTEKKPGRVMQKAVQGPQRGVMWGKAHQRKLLMHFSQLRRRSKSNVEGRLEGKSGSLKSVAAKTKKAVKLDTGV